MTRRIELTITVEADLDAVPGLFHQPEDWVRLIKRDLEAQSHYNPKVTGVTALVWNIAHPETVYDLPLKEV